MSRAAALVAIGALGLAGGCNHLPLVTPAAAATATVTAPRIEQAAEVSQKTLEIPNETMEFRVTLRGITVGLVQTAIGTPGWLADGRRAIIVKSHGRSDGLIAIIGDLQWELTTTIDLDRGTPISDREESSAELAGKKEHEDDDHTWAERDTSHDIHSVIGALRGWRSEIGEPTHVEVSIGSDHVPLDVARAGSEYLASADKPAVRYEGTANHRFHFAIWVSDDAARVPLLFRADTELGTIAVELVDYQVPREP